MRKMTEKIDPSLTKGKGRYTPGTMPVAQSRPTQAREADKKNDNENQLKKSRKAAENQPKNSRRLEW